MVQWNNIESLPTLEERVEAERQKAEAIVVCMQKLSDEVQVTVRRTTPQEEYKQRISNIILIKLLAIWEGLFKMIHNVQAEPLSLGRLVWWIPETIDVTPEEFAYFA